MMRESLCFLAVLALAGAFNPAVSSPLFMPRTGVKQVSKARSLPFLPIRGGSSNLKRASEVSGGDASSDDDDIFAVLEIDKIEAEKALAENWGFVLSGGILSAIGGFMALLLPVQASGVAYNAILYALAVLGFFNMVGLFTAEEGFRVPSFIVGGLEFFLAVRMYQEPFESLKSLTKLVAATCIVDGVHQASVSIRNRADMPQWGWRLVNGIASVVAGIYAVKQMPVSTLVVPGFALGLHLLSSGAMGVFSGLCGRDSAIEKMA